MNDLSTMTLEARGGSDLWRGLGSVSTDLSVGGALWDLKGLRGRFATATYGG
jgi:hypothetical protein